MQPGLIAAGPRWLLGPFPPSPSPPQFRLSPKPQTVKLKSVLIQTLHATAVQDLLPSDRSPRALQNDTQLEMCYSSSLKLRFRRCGGKVSETQQDSTVVSPRIVSSHGQAKINCQRFVRRVPP